MLVPPEAARVRGLERALAVLEAAGVEAALIGAMALASRGVARSTTDFDLLVVHDDPLLSWFWTPLRQEGMEVEVRPGEPGDPLAGVVRIQAPGDPLVDVVVGQTAWQHDLVLRAEPLVVTGVSMRVARAADLILLKLYAGGPSDRWDIERLLEVAPDRAACVAEVEAELPRLPAECRTLWDRIRSGLQ